MSNIVISPEVPQWLLDIFNKINFKQVSTFKKVQLITIMKFWANSNLKKLDPNKQYKKTGAKKISKDFDIDLLNLMNEYEYSSLPESYIKEMKKYLNDIIKKELPLK